MGVPQGSVVAPTLFVLMLADIGKGLRKDTTITTYADDIAVWRRSRHRRPKKDSAQHKVELRLFQSQVDSVVRHLESLGFLLSPNKTVSMHVHLPGYNRGHYPTWNVLSICGTKLPQAVRHESWGQRRETLIHLTQSLVRSRLLFGAQALHDLPMSAIRRMATVECQALRLGLGLPQSVPQEQVYCEAGILPFWHRLKRDTCRYLLSSARVPNSKDTELGEGWNPAPPTVSGHGLVSSVSGLCSRAGIEPADRLRVPQAQIDPYPPWIMKPPEVRTNVPGVAKEDPPHQIATCTRELLAKEYADDFKIFTDGSVLSDGRTGAGLFFETTREHFEGLYKLLSFLRIFISPSSAAKMNFQDERSQYLCIRCKKPVRPRQEGLLCDWCDQWQHRTCQTGISREEYRKAVREETEIDWQCDNCVQSIGLSPPDAESTRLDQGFLILQSIDRSATFTAEELQEIEEMEVHESEDPVAAVSFLVPEPLYEPSIEDQLPRDISFEETAATTYEILKSGSQKGQEKLYDNEGYTYMLKRTLKNGQKDWTCSVRNKNNRCNATVKQNGMHFTRGPQAHIHLGQVGANTVAAIRVKVKEIAAKDVFVSAAEIVNGVVLDQLQPNQPIDPLPTLDNLARAANRHRQARRPRDPTNLNFDIDENFLPEFFLRSTAQVGHKKHYIFANENMLNLLRLAKTWYVDGTFKVVRNPFVQLFSIHAFVRKGDDCKQVPLLFCLMSSRRKRDYKKLFKEVKRIVDGEVAVQNIVVDYEAAVWRAVPKVFAGVKISGCAFHWTQCLWRKIVELGLTTAYKHDEATHKFCKQMMALVYIPHEHIEQTFDNLKNTEADSIC
ncbi:uncharacterized protein LOC143024111 [Oratosquilla oratoria]|uniref:uncharacterized protein LOC143024111 n=1 Tax=Oratosquilla oratoria TaxID=337810 RepID=UPI003F76B0F1